MPESRTRDIFQSPRETDTGGDSTDQTLGDERGLIKAVQGKPWAAFHLRLCLARSADLKADAVPRLCPQLWNEIHVSRQIDDMTIDPNARNDAQDIPPPHESWNPVPPQREPVFNLATIVIVFIALCVGIHLIRVFALTGAQDFWVMLHFAFIPLRYSGGYEMDLYAVLAPATYSLLHGGTAHLVVNMIWLAAFGSPLANRIGTVRFILFWIATSVAAVGLHYVLHSGDVTPVVGASGAISGMMGAAARYLFRIDRSFGRPAFAGPIQSIPAVFRSRQAVMFLAVWLVVNLVTAFGFGAGEDGASIAWEAHIGGFLAGFLGLRLFDRKPPALR